jgi:hypothetical protein
MIGQALSSSPIYVNYVGGGAIKVALVGTETVLNEVFQQFQAAPNLVDQDISLYFAPATEGGSYLNEDSVNIFANASNPLDGCKDNDWSPDQGGTFPFSEPETLASREFLSDASIVIFVEIESEFIVPAGCPVTPTWVNTCVPSRLGNGSYPI